jgi:phosphate transport system substrate-binding protein
MFRTAHRKAAALALATACSFVALPAAAASAGTITLTGSTSVFPLIKQLTDTYHSKHPKTNFRITQGGSDIGINSAARGSVTLGTSSRDPQASDPKLNWIPFARDGICIVTNPSNPIGNFSRSTIQQIFAGRYRTWNQVPGHKITGPIQLVTRTPASGTADAFQNIFMGANLKISGNAAQKSSNGLVQAAVRSNKFAIAYLDFKFSAGTWAAPYQGVKCNLGNAKRKSYKALRNFFLVWKRVTRKPAYPANAEAKAFVLWTQSKAAQAIVARGWVPIT